MKGSTSDVTARMMLQRLDLVTLANKHKREERCAAFIEEAMANFEDINIYDVYADVCLRDAPGKQLARVMGKHPAGLAFRAALSRECKLLAKHATTPWYCTCVLISLLHLVTLPHDFSCFPEPRYDPCIDDEVERYFNRRDVQDALHANLTGAIPGPWTSCNPAIEYSRDDVLASMLPVYDKLLKSGIKMLLYTGDVDAIVPIIGTRKWIRDLDLKVEEAWRPWRSVTGQVGGWTVQHEKGLSFASVRGAGHMVPYTRPERAFYLFSQWVHEKPL